MFWSGYIRKMVDDEAQSDAELLRQTMAILLQSLLLTPGAMKPCGAKPLFVKEKEWWGMGAGREHTQLIEKRTSHATPCRESAISWAAWRGPCPKPLVPGNRKFGKHVACALLGNSVHH
jgi:hypothetical protein